jgi:hypothetical protein
MNDNLAKTVSTVAIWLATAIIFAGGVCRMNVDGVGLLAWAVISVALAIAPAVATHAIWSRSAQDTGARRESEPAKR